MPSHCWESYLCQVKAMVVDHFVRSVRHQSKSLPKHYEMLFTGSEVPSGPIELSQVQRDKRKLGTMCHALIAEHMFTPNPDSHTGDGHRNVHSRGLGSRNAIELKRGPTYIRSEKG